MPLILNIAAYQFAPLQNLPDLRAQLAQLCSLHHLRGSILLSTEGLNLFVAGERPDIDALLARVRQIPGLEHIPVKESLSSHRPFNRMLVKIKREIIAFGVPGIDPSQHTSRRISPQQLKTWLDEGRPLTLLDTRNNFEFHVGTFLHALPANIEDFRDFPATISRLPTSLKNQTVVTFCTGGIRCEKAAPLLEREGFTDVYQLDGGILKYFADCGAAHFHGHCFVFDQRVALNSSLQPADLHQCFACQSVLSSADLTSPLYTEGQSCPHCSPHPASPQ